MAGTDQHYQLKFYKQSKNSQRPRPYHIPIKSVLPDKAHIGVMNNAPQWSLRITARDHRPFHHKFQHDLYDSRISLRNRLCRFWFLTLLQASLPLMAFYSFLILFGWSWWCISSLRITAQSCFVVVDLVWGNISEPYVIHINSTIVSEQKESSFQQFFGPLRL